MGIHADYDAYHKRRDDDVIVAAKYYVHFTDPQGGRTERYEYPTADAANYEAARQIEDGMLDVSVERRKLSRGVRRA